MNLEPHSLDDILENIREVGKALGAVGSAERVISSLRLRIEAVSEKTRRLAARPRVVCLEWVDPPYCGGHWMKELVELAGGQDGLAVLHRPSRRIEWRHLIEFAPEAIVLTCCGFGLERVRREGEILAGYDGFFDLPAVTSGRVFATDGSSYFSRPGPRIVDSLEILAHLIHPELFSAPAFAGAFAAIDLSRRSNSARTAPLRRA